LIPAPSPVAEVVTRSAAATALTPGDLAHRADRLRDRLQAHGWVVETFAERSIGTVEVGNSRGVTSEYPVTTMGVGIVAWPRDGRDSFRAHRAQVGPIEAVEIEGLAREVEEALAPVAIGLQSIPRTARVWFAPRAVRALLGPLLIRLAGSAWLEGKDRWPLLDDRLTLIDDPHQPGRPGSRPIDDDGVPTRPLRLIDRGRAVAGILDVATGSRHLIPSTGHGWRRGPTRPRIGFSNLILAPDRAGTPSPAAAVGSGFLVRDLRLGPAPNPETGVFRIVAPWVYRIEGGEVVGRVEDLVLGGNVFELLGPGRVVAVGAEAEWIGAVSAPPLILDGVTLRRR
jgi:PmbA protein